MAISDIANTPLRRHQREYEEQVREHGCLSRVHADLPYT
jgi:hypothetical protein